MLFFYENDNRTLNKQLAFTLNVLGKVLKKLDLRRKKYVLSMAFDQYLDNLLSKRLFDRFKREELLMRISWNFPKILVIGRDL